MFVLPMAAAGTRERLSILFDQPDYIPNLHLFSHGLDVDGPKISSSLAFAPDQSNSLELVFDPIV
jgi:hypothetical protein